MEYYIVYFYYYYFRRVHYLVHMHNQNVVVAIPHGAANNITQHFVPNPVSINDDNTIKWINEDTIIHIVNGVKDMAIDDIKSKHTADLGLKTSLFDSNILYPTYTFYYTFDQEGIYNYICIIPSLSYIDNKCRKIS